MSPEYQLRTARTNLTNCPSSFRCSFVDFSRTWEQIAFHHSVCDFADQELDRGADERDRVGRFPTKAWEKCAEFGIFSLYVAVKDGTIAVCLDL
jgi:alkylation response protein AidB-like acyl-CoA dehydrogenase